MEEKRKTDAMSKQEKVNMEFFHLKKQTKKTN